MINMNQITNLDELKSYFFLLIENALTKDIGDVQDIVDSFNEELENAVAEVNQHNN